MLDKTVVSRNLGDGALHITWKDGHRSTFHYIWLRDNCPCPECRHSTGQRIFETYLIPPDVHPDSLTMADDVALEIVWANGGHISRFIPSWLRANCYSSGKRDELRPPLKLWNAGVLQAIPEAPYLDVSTSEDSLKLWLTMIADYGIALLRDVPAVSGALINVVDLFGFVRETNFGRLFDVRTLVDPNDVAYTSLPLPAHTDNPYRDPVPSLQLLHCLSSSTIGGDTTIVDGFCVADALREREPNKFELLSSIPIRFSFSDKDADLEAEVTLIELTLRGDVETVRFSCPATLPFDLDPEVMEDYYDAYCTFGSMLESPEYQVRFKLDQGDLYIVDNTRVMHGRSGYSGEGNRHLQGVYADKDALFSKLRVLNRA